MQLPFEADAEVGDCKFCLSPGIAGRVRVEHFESLRAGAPAFEWFVRCTDCDARGPSCHDRQSAVLRWNGGMSKLKDAA